jgi:hypothetical protein
MRTRINQSAFYVSTPAFVAAKHLVSGRKGLATLLALPLVFFNGCQPTAGNVKLLAPFAFFAVLMEFR